VKIVVLDPADFLGGAELFTTEILGKLKDKVRFTVLTSGDCKPYLKAFPDEVNRKQIPLPRLRPFSPFQLMKSVLALKKYLKKNPNDILHSNSVRAGIIAAFSGKHPWTHFAHDFTLPKYLVFFFSRADRIFCCSAAVQNDLLQKGLPKEKLLVIPNGIDTKYYASLPQKKWSSTRPVIGLVGRIDTWKGQDVFLKTAQIMQHKMPKAEFRIYGESNRHDQKTVDFEHRLKRSVNENNLGNVRFMGQKHMQQIVSEIDILVHASTKPEPFGRVILEAIAAQIPVIASDLGGTREILIGDILEHLLITPKDPVLLAEKILWLLQDDYYVREYKKAAQIRAKEFELKNIADKILKEWERL
jgi:glycosyltransferase involved in cell wall biosynthesis